MDQNTVPSTQKKYQKMEEKGTGIFLSIMKVKLFSFGVRWNFFIH